MVNVLVLETHVFQSGWYSFAIQLLAPILQLRLLSSLEYLPGEQELHPESDERPVAEEYLPGPHKTHSLSFFSPSVPLHRPGGQPLHVILSGRAYLPLVQFSQIAPGMELY